jgi:hypothetical protein
VAHDILPDPDNVASKKSFLPTCAARLSLTGVEGDVPPDEAGVDVSSPDPLEPPQPDKNATQASMEKMNLFMMTGEKCRGTWRGHAGMEQDERIGDPLVSPISDKIPA